jgi:hypothetical protein
VFGTVGFPLRCQVSSQATVLKMSDVLLLLPEARRYRDFDELGSDGWKLQSYFVSHFVYIMSDWGSVSLRRELYAEEFRYFAENLRRACKLKDPELIGEFVHCLRVLGVDPSRFPGSEDVLLEMAYLDAVQCLRQLETNGMWTSHTSSPYARYHSAWCGIVGLVCGPRGAPPAVSYVGRAWDRVNPGF